MNDPLDQRLEASIMNLKNDLDSQTFNGTTNFNPPKSYKAPMPKTKRLDIKSIFTGQGMPELEEESSPPEDEGMRGTGAFFDSTLQFVNPGGLGALYADPSTGNTPPTPAPAPPCPTSGNVTLVLSGVSSCGCASNTIVTLSIDGTYTIPVGGSLPGQGSFSAQGYSDMDCMTPVGDPTTGTFTVSASCTDGLWTVTALGSDGSFTPFTSATAVAVGIPADNAFQCGTGGVEAGGGTATVTT